MDHPNLNSAVPKPAPLASKPKAKSSQVLLYVNFLLLFAIIFSLGVNQVIIDEIDKGVGLKKNFISEALDKEISRKLSPSGSSAQLSGQVVDDATKIVVSQGVPEVYGAELGVSFDQVQASINVMRQYDPYDFKPGGKRIILAGDDLKRYIDIGSKIACEYCCGAKALIDSSGKAACGCAHSMAMRGLAAYLIQNHGGQYTNDQILRELARWKGLYFPKQMIQKLAEQLQSGNYTPDIAALVMGLKLPDYGKGSTGAPLPSDVKNLPNMVGGC